MKQVTTTLKQEKTMSVGNPKIFESPQGNLSGIGRLTFKYN